MDRFGSTLSRYLQDSQGNRPGVPMASPIQQLLQRDRPPTLEDVGELLPYLEMARPDIISQLLNISQRFVGQNQASPQGDIFQSISTAIDSDPNYIERIEKYTRGAKMMKLASNPELAAAERYKSTRGQTGRQPNRAAPGQQMARKPGGGVGGRGAGPGQIRPANPNIPTYGGRGPAMGQPRIGPQARVMSTNEAPEGMLGGIGQGAEGTMRGANMQGNNILASFLQGAGQQGEQAPQPRDQNRKMMELLRRMMASGQGLNPGNALAPQLATNTLSGLINGGMV